MRDVLIVLNPRRIAECLSAIESLPIDKVWVRNMSEPQIVDCWSTIVALLEPYEWAWIVSDDACPRPHALEALRELAADGYPVVTGYSNLDRENMLVNLVRRPLGPNSTKDAFDLLELAWVMESKGEVIQTYFAGFSLTGMSVDMWEAYPYGLEEGGYSADYNLSKRLEEDGISIVAHRDAFVWHTKEVWCEPDQELRKQLWVGVRPPEIVLEPLAVPA